jgi:hypothetical protein
MGRSFKFGMTECKIDRLTIWILWISVSSLRTPAVDEIPVGGRNGEIISRFTSVKYSHQGRRCCVVDSH